MKTEEIFMKKTTTYQLNQWEKSDRIQMEDFNSDNMKVEQALAAQAETQREMAAALANCGNCKIVYGSYTGTGTYESSGANTLSFEHKPIFLAIMPQSSSDNAANHFFAVRGGGYAYTYSENFNSINMITWGDRTVRWYSYNATHQYNKSGSTYHYVALLVDE